MALRATIEAARHRHIDVFWSEDRRWIARAGNPSTGRRKA
jgi:hypothetical protein